MREWKHKIKMTFEALKQKQGAVLGTSDPIKVDQQMIDAFADATGDHQFIHTDPERSKSGPFGGTIAHGFLILSLTSKMAQDCLPDVEGCNLVINLGFDRLRFVSPVPSGASVFARFVLENIEEKGDALRLMYAIEVIIKENEKLALVARWITLHKAGDE